MRFLVIGLSHKTTPLEIREKYALNEEGLRKALEALISEECFSEVFIVSTCNRVEAYVAVLTNADEALTLVRRHVFGNAEQLPLYLKQDQEAVEHLFCVTAGLDSLVVGEPQIAGQVKEAHAFAVKNASVGPYLNKLVQKAQNVAKRVRTETEIGKHPVSVAYASVLLAEQIFGDLQDKQVLLLGAGEMGCLAAQHLLERGVDSVWVTNRSGEKLEKLMQEGSSQKLKTLPWEEWEDELQKMDVVIVSTGADHYLVNTDQVSRAMNLRKNEAMFWIDMAVPRNVDPAVNDLAGVYLYDVDHLQGIVTSNLQQREKEAQRAAVLIREEGTQFMSYAATIELSPTIQQLSAKFETIRLKELEKHVGEFSGKDREAVEACTKAIVNKILHDPILLLKTDLKIEADSSEGGISYTDILKKMFRLEDGG